MKRAIKFSLIILISQLFLFSATAKDMSIKIFDDSDDAINYNDEMIKIQSEIDNALVILLDAIDTGKGYNIKGALKETKKTIKGAKKSVKKTGAFNDNEQYQEEMLKLIAMYEDIMKDEIPEIIKITLSSDELSETQYTELGTLYDSALGKYDAAFTAFQTYQYEFAEKWDFSIEE